MAGWLSIKFTPMAELAVLPHHVVLKLFHCLSKYLYSQNELSSSIAANFCPTFFLLRFSFLCYFFLLIGIGQKDNDV